MKEFIEIRMINAIRELLTGRVNELLGEFEFTIPLIEFGNYESNCVIIPEIVLTSCEQTEKERIIRIDAYSLMITFSLPESPESELYCYAYSTIVDKALNEDITLGGIVNRVVITGKKYARVENSGYREVLLTLRLTVEGNER